MGVNLQLTGAPEGDHATDLATNGGYSSLCDWIGGLPGADYPALVAFADAGLFSGTDRLADDINRAIEGSPPDDPDTLDVANRLADLLGVGRPDETASIPAG